MLGRDGNKLKKVKMVKEGFTGQLSGYVNEKMLLKKEKLYVFNNLAIIIGIIVNVSS